MNIVNFSIKRIVFLLVLWARAEAPPFAPVTCFLIIYRVLIDCMSVVDSL